MMSVLYVSAVNIFKIKLFVSVIRRSWSVLSAACQRFRSALQPIRAQQEYFCDVVIQLLKVGHARSWRRSCFYNEYFTSRVRIFL